MKTDRAIRAIGIYGGGIFFGVMSVAQPFFTLYAETLGASTALIGCIVTLRALLPMFIAMPIGQMIDTLGPLRMTKIGCLLLMASLAIISWSTTLTLLAVSQPPACVKIGCAGAGRRPEAVRHYDRWFSEAPTGIQRK